MKKLVIILIIIGAILGSIIPVLEAMISYADTAQLDASIDLDIPDKNFFIQKTAIYILIGAIAGLFIGTVISIIKKQLR